jgi:hypothetical protein
MVLQHPAGQAQLEKAEPGKAWVKFAERQTQKAPSPDDPRPAGSISVGALVSKLPPRR